MNAEARADAMDKVITMLKGHPSYRDAKAYCQSLNATGDYRLDDPAEELVGLEDLLDHLKRLGHQPGTAGSIRAEITSRIPLECGCLPADCECQCEDECDDGLPDEDFVSGLPEQDNEDDASQG